MRVTSDEHCRFGNSKVRALQYWQNHRRQCAFQSICPLSTIASAPPSFGPGHRPADGFDRILKLDAARELRPSQNGIPGVVTPMTASLMPAISL